MRLLFVLQCVAVCCSVLQCVAVCCSTCVWLPLMRLLFVLQWFVVCCSDLKLSGIRLAPPIHLLNTRPHAATHSITLPHTTQHTATGEPSGPRTGATYTITKHTATHCHTLPHTATHCHTLPHTATCCHALPPLPNAAKRCQTPQRTAQHTATSESGGPWTGANHTITKQPATHCNTLHNTLQREELAGLGLASLKHWLNTLPHTATHYATHCNRWNHRGSG